MKKYLPSKKFLYIITVFLALGIIFFLVSNFSIQKKFFFFSNKEESSLLNENSTISDTLKVDTDGDGVFDWEETLWGTDKNNKTTFGISDLTYIENKKKELNIDQNTDIQGLTETEKFAREFFATYIAMKTSGNDVNTINNFSNALGQKIIYPALIDSYSMKDVNVSSNEDVSTRMEYYTNLKKIFENYKAKGIGNELSIVANGLTSSETSSDNSNKLLAITSLYQDFAKKIMEMSVPQSLTSYHLDIANNSNNTGISVKSMTKITNDPIVGISGLSQYQDYSDRFIKAVQDLETKLQE